jgi:hypothetical protein
MKRSSNIEFGIFFGFLTLALIITGFYFSPGIPFILAAVSLGISLRFFFAQRDVTCIFTA